MPENLVCTQKSHALHALSIIIQCNWGTACPCENPRVGMADYEAPTDAELAAIKVENWTGEKNQVEDLMHARFINDMEAAGVFGSGQREC